ncbi:MAG: peptidylprolyl isomerase [Proteobacteria bacterium]|nr:peptidylprolyl isomerase [Pseudomonadota bacterium]
MRIRIHSLLALLACLLLAVSLAGCGKHANKATSGADDESAAANPVNSSASPTAMDVAVPLAAQSGPRVALHTNMGDIVIELYPDKAPKTVANFLTYAKEGFYDGTVFNRVIDDLLIQGGAYTPDLQKKGGVHAAIPDEANNGLSNQRGTVSAARALAPGSATSEFFINLVDNPRFDYVSDADATTAGYAVFGKVVSGMDVVDKIRLVKTHGQGKFTADVPVTPVVIDKVEILPPASP